MSTVLHCSDALNLVLGISKFLSESLFITAVSAFIHYYDTDVQVMCEETCVFMIKHLQGWAQSPEILVVPMFSIIMVEAFLQF